MARRKNADTLDRKRRRMPFTAKIKRGDPFRSADQREIYAMCRRIAGAAEHCSSAGWREESATCSTTSRPGRRRGPCSTGSTAAGSRTGRCPSSARRRRKQPKGSDKRSRGGWRRARCATSCRPTGGPARAKREPHVFQCRVRCWPGAWSAERRGAAHGRGPARVGAGKSPGMVLSLRAAYSACPRDASSCPDRKPAGPDAEPLPPRHSPIF